MFMTFCTLAKIKKTRGGYQITGQIPVHGWGLQTPMVEVAVQRPGRESAWAQEPHLHTQGPCLESGVRFGQYLVLLLLGYAALTCFLWRFRSERKYTKREKTFQNEATTFGTPGCRVLVVLPPAHGEEHSDQADQLV